MTKRSQTRRTVIVSVGVTAAATLLAACAGDENTAQDAAPTGADQSTLDAKGPDAQAIMDLFTPFFWVAVVIGVLVVGATVYAAIRFRARSDDDRPIQTHGHTGIEIGWTIIPALILAVMAVPTVATIFDLATEPEGDVVEIRVTGKQWWWEYDYIAEGVVAANEMVIPVGEPVTLRLTSDDAIHSFWVPNLAGKKDVVPGRVHFLRIEADEPGLFLGQCAEYCGLSHANMRLRVTALERAEYDAWIESQRAGLSGEQLAFIEDPDGVVQTYGCVACHSFASSVEDVTARIGPNLTHLASRESFAGAIFDLTEENLRRWVRDAPGMKPMQTGDQPGDAPSTPGQVPGMPAFPEMTDDEVDALVSFLLTLQ